MFIKDLFILGKRVNVQEAYGVARGGVHGARVIFTMGNPPEGEPHYKPGDTLPFRGWSVYANRLAFVKDMQFHESIHVKIVFANDEIFEGILDDISYSRFTESEKFIYYEDITLTVDKLGKDENNV